MVRSDKSTMRVSKVMAHPNSKKPKDKVNAWVFDYLDNLPVGICRSTVEGKMVYCNKSMCRIFGFDSIDEVMAFPIIELYWDKKDRGNLIKSLIEHGQAEELVLPFKTRQGVPVWCAVNAQAVFDDDDIMIYLDVVVRDITNHFKGLGPDGMLYETIKITDNIAILMDLDGVILDINMQGLELLKIKKDNIIDMEFTEFLADRDKNVFPVFLSEVRRQGRKEAILAIIDLSHREHFIEFQAFLVRGNGKRDHIKCVARDISEQVRRQSEELIKEKFQGVLEMAGGVAHQLNQPLTVVNHLIMEIMGEVASDSSLYERINRIYDQIQKMNEVALKIRGINRYKAMDYVDGLKIVDLDKAHDASAAKKPPAAKVIINKGKAS